MTAVKILKTHNVLNYHHWQPLILGWIERVKCFILFPTENSLKHKEYLVASSKCLIVSQKGLTH